MTSTMDSGTARDEQQAPRAAASAGPLLRRVVRRETHSNRATIAIMAAVLVICLAAYGLLESAVHAIGQPPWLIDPQEAMERIVALPAGISPVLLGAIGAVVAMLGLVFFFNGVLPGRRARHSLTLASNAAPHHAVVVDDEVIASSLARRARLAANVTPAQVMVVVSQRHVQVNLRPTSGVPVSHDAVQSAVQDELNQMALVPSPEVRIHITPAGVIGA
ncbi:hypothetical protein PSET11_00445 [Arthrobacter ulcerisalmonis]|uniref:DUF6286 domain-containing protein n=1 Tax=Arthrobacter ulcerisalmonis TaxID=2483813 RepID=A0A3P5WUV2_9MICC|nr:DUF6286 domain-containing protein [Arthrobacter ulcerisalmonis]VDC18681.1 hypothetical protein PSET11_00445 [Arthrobacter ulcerisalmonis]